MWSMNPNKIWSEIHRIIWLAIPNYSMTGFNSYSELRPHQIKLKGPYMVNPYHQKTFIVLKSNVMSKSNVKMFQYKQNICTGNYRYSIEHGISKKWS